MKSIRWGQARRRGWIDAGGLKGAVATLEKEYKAAEAEATRLQTEDQTAYKTTLTPALADCRSNKAFRSNAWNRTAWSIGVAQTFHSKTGDLEKLRGEGVSLWSTFAYGFDHMSFWRDTTQIIGHVHYRTNEQVPIEGAKGQFFKQDKLLVGARLRYGEQNLHFSVEADYVHADRSKAGRPSEKYKQYVFGADYKLSDNVWLNATVGKTTGKKTEQDDTRAVASFKWAIGEAPVF